MTAPRPDLSEPLRRLGEGVTSWLAANGSGYTPPAGTGRAAAEPGAPQEQPAGPTPADRPAAAPVHPSSCRGCPVCTVLGVLRGERPDVTEALADVLGAAANALRALSAPPPVPPVAEPTRPAEDLPGPDGPAVQRIDVA